MSNEIETIDMLTARNIELAQENARLKAEAARRLSSPGSAHPEFRRKMRDRVAIAMLSAWEGAAPSEARSSFADRVADALAAGEDFVRQSEAYYQADLARLRGSK